MKRQNPNSKKPFKRGDRDNKNNYFWCYVKNKKLIDGYFSETWVSESQTAYFSECANKGHTKTCTKCGKTKGLKTISLISIIRPMVLNLHVKIVF